MFRLGLATPKTSLSDRQGSDPPEGAPCTGTAFFSETTDLNPQTDLGRLGRAAARPPIFVPTGVAEVYGVPLVLEGFWKDLRLR